MKIVKVLIEYSISTLNRPFSYVIDDNINIQVGYRVNVNFHNKNVVGYVIEITNTNLDYISLCNKDNIRYKKINYVIDDKAIINDELFEIAKKMEYEYITPLIGCLQTILPPSYKPSSSSIGKVKEKTIIKVMPNLNNDFSFTKRQKEIYDLIVKNNGILLKELPSHIVTKLLESKAIYYKKEIVNEDYFKDYSPTIDEHILNDEQQKCYDEFLKSNDNIFLLEGVTGSGKTEVYIKLVKYYLSLNKTAIILVPEISLTPMIIKRFKYHFSNIAVLHGSLSIKEKQKQYDLIKDGKANVVIGARSAIFAPLKNIGIIILDEEQSNSYKQDKAPAYHAREIAIMRSKYHHCKVLLGSATPSFESKARAQKNVYHLLSLSKRANSKPLPKVDIVNMREETSDFSNLISYSLDYEIKRRLDKKEKIILLHNRRGYSPYVSCRKCGYIFKCPNCELSMSYHKNGDKFKCHYCNFEMKFDHKCPKCDSNDFLFMGSGTQKIEEVIEKFYPQAKVLRMDNDTTSVKNGHLAILEKFENEDYNLLLGTQMVAKGLDFHDVTLVGVINADLTLAVADFRSNESTYELLSQVAGRAGRGNKPGQVIIQTYQPDHYVIQYASLHEYDKFYKKEMDFRYKMNYPPFSYLSSITILSEKSDQVCILADKIFYHLKQYKEFELLGPALPYVFKENNKIKMRILLKSKNRNLNIEKLNEVNTLFAKEILERKCSIIYDIDTYQLL